jgi:hypothetical protein
MMSKYVAANATKNPIATPIQDYERHLGQQGHAREGRSSLPSTFMPAVKRLQAPKLLCNKRQVLLTAQACVRAGLYFILLELAGAYNTDREVSLRSLGHTGGNASQQSRETTKAVLVTCLRGLCARVAL